MEALKPSMLLVVNEAASAAASNIAEASRSAVDAQVTEMQEWFEEKVRSVEWIMTETLTEAIEKKLGNAPQGPMGSTFVWDSYTPGVGFEDDDTGEVDLSDSHERAMADFDVDCAEVATTGDAGKLRILTERAQAYQLKVQEAIQAVQKSCKQPQYRANATT